MTGDRRQGLRRQVKSLVYVNIDSHNGGILINLSKAGLAMRVIDPVICNQPVRVAFCLPVRGDCVEVTGQVAWTDEVGLTAGVRGMDVTSPSQELIDSWLSNGSGHGGEESSTSVVEGVRADESIDRTPADPEFSNTSQPNSPTEGDRREPALTELRQAFSPTGSGNVSGRQRSSWKWATPRKRIAGLIGAGIIVAVLAGTVLLLALTTPRYQPSGWVAGVWASVRQVIALGRATATSSALDQNPNNDRSTEQARSSTGQPRTVAALVQRSDHNDEKEPSVKSVTQPDSMSAQVTRAANFRVEGSSEHRLVAAFARRNATRLPRVGGAQRERLRVAQQPSVVPLVNYGASQEAPGAISERRVPLYPQAARQRSIEGTVVVSASINTDGTVSKVRLISGDPLLAGAVLDAVRQWRYGPHLENGQPSERETQITVTFEIFTE